MSTKAKIIILLIPAACFFLYFSQQTDRITHGEISYDLNEVFAGDAKALALARAAGSGNISKIRQLVRDGAHIDSAGKEGITPLFWAIWAGNWPGFEELLALGANPNGKNTVDGVSIMVCTATNPDERFLKAALAHGGNPNAKNSVSGESLLMTTALYGLLNQSKFLIESGVDIHATDKISGITIPMIAISSMADFKFAYDLIQRGADPSAKTSWGATLADFAASEKLPPNSDRSEWRLKLLNLLNDKGVVPNPPTLDRNNN